MATEMEETMRNTKFIKKVKRFLSGFVAYAMATTMLPTIPAFAATGTTTYTYDGYIVDYTVVNEWDNGQSIEVKITNTGDESILNWAFKYDADGEISNLWNAAIVDSNNTDYIIKNSGWNYEIAPNQSVNFGYTLTDDNLETPSDFELCSERIDLSGGYDVNVNIINSWDTGVQGELVISNISDSPIEAWILTFDTNFVIDNLWDGRIIENTNNHYIIASEMWTNPIPVGGSTTVGFVGTKGVDIEAGVNNFTLSSVILDYAFLKENNNSMLLHSETNEVLGDSGNKTMMFYLMTNAEVSSIPLINSDTNEIVATLVDNGQYTVTGDDMMGDGIYSGKITLNTDVEDDIVYNFHAEMNQVISNKVAITIISPFTSQELSDMEYVQKSISEVLKKYATPEEYLQVPHEFLQNNVDFDYCALYEERCAAITEILSILQIDGKINNYYYDEENKIFACEYSNGIPFLIIPTDLLETVTYEDDLFLLPETEYDGYNAVILNSFENNDFRTHFYEEFTEEWIDKGMVVDYDDEVTVADLMTKLSNNDIICLSGHGLINNGRSAFCLIDEAVTPTTISTYTLDIAATRIEPVTYSDGTSSYIIYDTFINHHYGSGGLSGAFVFSESCTFMGSHDNIGYDDTFANAFINSSAESVIGFENSVMAVYSRELMLCYFEELLNGKSVNEAFESAKNEYGYNDYEYRKPSFLEYLFDRDAFDKMGATAYPHMVGNGDAVLTKELKNGNWESYEQVLTSTPCEWEYSGDARVLTKLGDIAPYNSRMAFLSTGIGSNSGVSMSGSQGSTLFQTIRNTNKTSLEFSYDFISEEPMAYVGSRYDDKFEVQILDTNDNILHSEILETINTSKWYSVSGVDFDGGDSTVYHTNWETTSIDISPYQNQTIIIKFLVYDVGDSAYDSAVVLDNIVCN